MRAFLLGTFLLAGLVSHATAQVVVGPIAIKNNVNGVPITISATSWTTVNSVDNEFTVTARIFADLIDLQKKVSSVVATFKLPVDSCANRSVGSPNPVVALRSSSLWPRDDQLVMFIRGNVDLWSCIAGPSKSEIQWQKRKVVFMKMKVPVIRTWTNVKKSKDSTQPLDVSLPIHLVKKDNATVGLEIAKPDVKLEGQHPLATNAIQKVANVDINKEVYNSLQSAIDPTKLKAVLPKELQKLDMTVVSARFRDYGGHAIAEINLAARVSGNPTAQLFQQTAASPSN